MDEAYRDADKYYNESQGQSVDWSWRFQALKAQSLLFQGKTTDALRLLEPELPTSLATDTRARKFIVLADTLCRLGAHERAETLLTQADDLLATNDGGLRAELELARGRCALDHEAAKVHFDNASKLAHNRDEFLEAAGLLNSGFLLLQEEHYDEAIDKFLLGLKVTSSPLLQDRMLGNLGVAYSRLGDWQRAISYSERAEKMASEMGSGDARERWLIDLGTAHFALWQLSDAEAYYVKALSIAQQLGHRTQAAVCFHDLAQVALRRQELNKAEQYWKQGEDLHQDSERTYLAMDRAEIALAQKNWHEAERLFLDLKLSSKANVVLRSMALRELGNVFWQQKKLTDADQAYRTSIETAESAAAQIKLDEYRLSFLDQERFYDDYIRFLISQGRGEEAIRVAERSRAQVWAQAHNKRATERRFSFEAARANLKSQNQTVLAFWVTDEESFLWVITPATFRVFKLPPHRDLQVMIEAFNQEIQKHNGIEDSPAAQRLYEALIGPAERLIPNNAPVIVIPSKLLSWVSFEALVVPGPHPHYWIEDANVQIAGALARVSAESRRTDAARKKILLLGAPVEATSDFPALKDAEREMKRIQFHFPATQQTVISGRAATPQAYSASNPSDYRLIHLDTHGTASDLSPLDSAIILSPDPRGSYKLYAREIKDIPIDADLVTISACYGAGTRWYNNEGVVGLGWAFLRAGAHRVIAGLWEADGAATAQLMDDFYGELTEGKTAAEALRDAKLKMLHSNTFYRHPYYWASLQLYTGS